MKPIHGEKPRGVSLATGLFQRVLHSAVAWSFLAAFLRFGGVVVVMPVVVRVLSPEELGLWYVFLSLGAMTALLDVGMAPTATRAVACLWAGAPRLVTFGMSLDLDPRTHRGPNEGQLRELISTLKFYYLALGVGTFLLMATVGTVWIWHKTESLGNSMQLRISWGFFALGSALNLSGALWTSLCAGINQVRHSQRIIVVAQTGYYLVVFFGLAAGFGFVALSVAFLISGGIAYLLGRWTFWRLLNGGKPYSSDRPSPAMIRTLWPLAWRTGGVSLGAYLILRANTIISSEFLGLEGTASYGLSLQAVMLITQVSGVWVQTKIPLFSQLRTQGRNQELSELFASRLKLSMLTYVIGAMGLLLLGPELLGWMRARTSLLPAFSLVVMLVIFLLEMHHSQYASLVLTENFNPFLWPAILSGLGIVATSLVLTPAFGVWGLLISQGVVQAAYNNWWTVVRGVRGIGIPLPGYWRRFFHIQEK